MTLTERFVPANPVQTRIKAGDFDGVIGAVRAMTEPQRAALAPSLRTLRRAVEAARWSAGEKAALWWGEAATSDQCDAASVALFFCGGDVERAEVWPLNDAVLDHLDLLAPASLKRLANDLARARPSWIHVVQRLVVEGRSDRPDCDEYVMGLMTACRNSRFGQNPLMGMIDADPGLLDGAILRLFEVEGNGEMNMAAAEKYTFVFEKSWTFTLLALIERGVFTRAQLIERTVSVLERDWPQFRAGWFSRFHQKLAPTPLEMAPLCERYAALCHSRIAPTVTLALSALRSLYDHRRVDGAMVLEALAPVASSAVKSQVESALKFTEAVVKREPQLQFAASALLVAGLVHESVELQKKLIARIAAWGVTEQGRAAVARMLPHGAAANRGALALLAGETAADIAAPSPDATPAAASLQSPVDGSRELAPINDIAELVQVVAHVLEDDSDPDLFERALDGVARKAPFDPDAMQRFAPLIKRAGRRIERPLSAALAQLLLFLAGVAGRRPSDDANTIGGELSRRLDDLMAFTLTSARLSALSTPTHRRGFIRPDILVGRLSAHQAAGASSSLAEQVRALLRLAPGDWPDARAQARTLGPSEFTDALRYALGDDIPAGANRALFVAAARIRHPHDDDKTLIRAYGKMTRDGEAIACYSWAVKSRESHGSTFHEPSWAVTPDGVEDAPAFIAARRHQAVHNAWIRGGYWEGTQSLLLYGASILPSNLDAFFADGALKLCFNRDWWEARWQDKAYLVLMDDASVPMTAVATRALACALGGKEPGQTAMGVDAFVAAFVEGRLDVALLGGHVRQLLEAQAGMAARFAKNLALAARAHPLLPAAVVSALSAMVRFEAVKPPKDTGALLELLHELALGNGLILPPEVMAAIARLALTGRGKAAQRDLLANR
jgi:hypothetical protein